MRDGIEGQRFLCFFSGIFQTPRDIDPQHTAVSIFFENIEVWFQRHLMSEGRPEAALAANSCTFSTGKKRNPEYVKCITLYS